MLLSLFIQNLYSSCSFTEAVTVEAGRQWLYFYYITQAGGIGGGGGVIQAFEAFVFT